MDELEAQIEASKRIEEARQMHMPWTCEVTPIGVCILAEDKSAKTMIISCNDEGVFVNKYNTDKGDFITYQELLDEWLLEVPPSHMNPTGGFTICGDQIFED